MNEKLKSQKGFVAVTLITLLAIALVLMVYASLLSTFTGGEVVVGSVAGDVWYSETNTTVQNSTTWLSTLNVSSTSIPWYSMVNFTSSYTGQVQITWQLEKMGGTWANVTNAKVITTDGLTGSGQEVWASSNGDIAGNRDWSQAPGATVDGQYRVKAYIETTS